MTGKTPAFLGILMLDTAFPRIEGDAGNVKSYDCPARLKIVKGAGSLDVVTDGPLPQTLIAAFCRAAQELEAEGATAIVSTCGFLVTAQAQIANAVSIPVMVSSLSLYPVLHRMVGGKRIGILTASKSALGDAALNAASIRKDDVVILGLEECGAFSEAILVEKDNQPYHMDIEAIKKAVLEKSHALVAAHPDLSAILLECGNLPPYAAAIEEATHLPVFSILDGARLLWRKHD